MDPQDYNPFGSAGDSDGLGGVIRARLGGTRPNSMKISFLEYLGTLHFISAFALLYILFSRRTKHRLLVFLLFVFMATFGTIAFVADHYFLPGG